MPTDRIRLSDTRLAILGELTNDRRYPNGAFAQWIANKFDHHNDTNWASAMLFDLVVLGFLQRSADGYYRITPAGRALYEDCTRIVRGLSEEISHAG